MILLMNIFIKASYVSSMFGRKYTYEYTCKELTCSLVWRVNNPCIHTKFNHRWKQKDYAECIVRISGVHFFYKSCVVPLFQCMWIELISVFFSAANHDFAKADFILFCI